MNTKVTSLIRPRVVRLPLVRPSLSPVVLAYLAERGLDGQAAHNRNLLALTQDQCKAEFAFALPALRIPYYSADGAPLQDAHGNRVARARLFPAGTMLDGKLPKFIQPKGSRNYMYLDPGRKNWRQVFAD